METSGKRSGQPQGQLKRIISGRFSGLISFQLYSFQHCQHSFDPMYIMMCIYSMLLKDGYIYYDYVLHVPTLNMFHHTSNRLFSFTTTVNQYKVLSFRL